MFLGMLKSFSFKNVLVDIINQYPIYSGIYMIVLGIIWLVHQIGKKESFRMKDHGLGSWGAMVSTWGVIISLIILGTILIVRSV